MEERFDRLAAPLIFVIALSLYLGLLTAQHSYDAVAGGILLYQWIANGAAAQLFHPYHILYLPLAAAVDALLDVAGLGQDPLTLLQMLNAIFAAAGVALFFRIARRVAIRPFLAAALTAMLGTAYSYWYYASNAESYAPSIFFLLLAFLSALSIPSVANRARIVRPGVWLGLAAGFHITCLLALPALLLAAWPPPSCEKPLRRPILVAVAVIAVALLPYLAVYAYFDNVDPFTGLTGELKATVDPGYRGKVWWSVDPQNVYRQWLGLGRAAASNRALQVALLALSLFPLALLTRGREKVRRLWMSLAWFFPTFLFFSSYNTASDKFAAYQWAPLLLLIGLGVQAWSRVPRARTVATGLVAALAVATAVANLAVVRRQADPGNNPHLARALAIAEHTGPEDVVVHLGRGENQYQKVYTPYFAVRRSMVLDGYFDKTRRNGGETLRLVGQRIDEHLRLKRNVVLLADAAEPTDSRRELEKLHELGPHALERFFAGFRPRVVAEDEDLGRLWSLSAPDAQPAAER